MSIRDEIRTRLEEERLVRLAPLIPGSKEARTMILTPEINQAVAPPWEGIANENRLGRLRGDLDHFVEGRHISVSLEPYRKPKSVYMAITDPIVNGIWDIRSRDPRPGLRVLGCIPLQDVFIGLEYDLRENLGGPGSKEWRDFILRAKAKWKILFPTYEPLIGSNADDFFRTNYSVSE